MSTPPSRTDAIFELDAQRRASAELRERAARQDRLRIKRIERAQAAGLTTEEICRYLGEEG